MTLAGRRVLITREADDSRRWAHRLSSAGAVPIVFPCITCETLDDPTLPGRLRAAAAECEWIVFSSVRGVEAYADLLDSREPTAESRLPCIAAVGPSTAMAARIRIGRVDLVTKRATAAGLGANLAAKLAGSSERVLVVGPEGGRTDVEQALADAGVACTRFEVYRTLPVPPSERRRDLAADGIQDILLASPSAVSGLCNAAVVPPDARIITIGPTTSGAAKAAGLTVWAEARQPSLEGMLEAIQ